MDSSVEVDRKNEKSLFSKGEVILRMGEGASFAKMGGGEYGTSLRKNMRFFSFRFCFQKKQWQDTSVYNSTNKSFAFGILQKLSSY